MGNKAQCLSPVNHPTKTIHHHHDHHQTPFLFMLRKKHVSEENAEVYSILFQEVIV